MSHGGEQNVMSLSLVSFSPVINTITASQDKSVLVLAHRAIDWIAFVAQLVLRATRPRAKTPYRRRACACRALAGHAQVDANTDMY